MRLIQVAKALGMTGQQLRKELLTVDFGIKPTDREIPDNLAAGIVRFIARKHGIEANMDVLTGGVDVMDDERPAAPAVATEQAEAPQAAEAAPAVHHEQLNVLRKLSLDDVPKEAIARQAQQLKTLSREEKEERAREEQAQKSRPKRRGGSQPARSQEQIKKKEGTVLLPAQITVKEFSEKAGVQVPKVIEALMKNGVLVTINQTIDYDTAAIVAAELGVAVAREQAIAMEYLLSRDLSELLKDEPHLSVPRPPIVVVMGHVDHGKTSLLDAIRKTEVAAGESGGITQHIGAYQVHHAGKAVTFLDTPGHQAFTAMRARGAKITDVAILVVAADEGIKETTVEAINHAKDADVPILVAVSKIDRPGADIEKVKGELAGHGLQPEEWGGSVPIVGYSAVTKQGITEVIDHVILLADLQELKANPNRPAVGTVIESHLDSSLGALATVIVNTGTLRVGDAFVCGSEPGKVRTMMDAAGQRLGTAGPSCPVRVSGFSDVPTVGDVVQVAASEREAKDLAEALGESIGGQQKHGFSDFVNRLHEGKLSQLKVVLKADAQGSLEAIRASLEQQGTEQVSVKVIHAAVGAVTENDVYMAAASGGLIFAFHVDVPQGVAKTAEREGVGIREHQVIYALLDEVSNLLAGLLEPEEQEKVTGHLEVKGVFLTKKSEQLIGGRVLDGVVKRLSYRLQRNGEVIGTGRITSLRKVDKDIKEAKEGSECGMRVEGSVLVEVGDVLEVFVKEMKKKEA